MRQRHGAVRMESAREDLNAALATLLPHRGDSVALARVVLGTQIPIVMFGSSRHYVGANPASRFLMRCTLEGLRRMQIYDVAPSEQRERHLREWAIMMELGFIAGSMQLTVPGLSPMPIDYATVANILPGTHLCIWLPSSWSADEVGSLIADAPRPRRSLTAREAQVLTLIARGATLHEAAAELALSQATVRTHLANAIRRLDARHRAHAVAIAVGTGEISLEPLPERSS